MKGITYQLSILILFSLLISIDANCQEGGDEGGSSGGIKEEIPASEVLYKIKMGQPVNYYYVTIKGDLDLNHLELPINPRMNSSYSQGVRVVSSPISIEASEIEGDFYAEAALFENLVNFENTNFNGYTYIYSSIFNETAIFSGSEFSEPVSFRGSQFNRSADFHYSKFAQYADFTNSIFSTGADFHRAEFDGYASFTGSKFNGIANFGPKPIPTLSGIAGGEDFEHNPSAQNIFSEDADFVAAEFNGTASFKENQFLKAANFRSSMFRGGADFNGAKFKGTNDFRGSNFLGFLNLTVVSFDRLDIYWPHSTRLICNDGPTYLALIKNFRDLEKYEIADEVYYEYRQWRQDEKSWSDISKYIDILGRITCGYGVRVSQTIESAMIIFVIFGVIYSIKCWRMYRINSNLLKIIKEGFLLSLIILLSAPGELYPPGVEDYRDKTRDIKYWPILERLIGWGLMLLLINTLSRVMIRY